MPEYNRAILLLTLVFIITAMTIRKISFIVIILIFAYNLNAQNNMKYRRNSLAEMMIYHSEDEFGNEIKEAFLSKPKSDKYDDHNIGFFIINNDSIPNVTKRSHGLVKAQLGKTLNSQDIKKNAATLEKIVNDAQYAKYMVAKWFGLDLNRQDFNVVNATFNMRLIQERGQYNASDIDVEMAQRTTRGVAALSDAGEELIGNTFLLINDMTYVTAEESAALAKGVMNVLGEMTDILVGGKTGSELASIGGDIADSFTGFTVKTHSYLFELEWNDSIAAIFYNNYYTSVPNPEKINAFLQDKTTFRLKYVAHEYEYGGKTSLVGKYDRKELAKMSCTRSIDKNIAALQLAYEDFKVKTPVYQILTDAKGRVEGYAAKIGMKEGITLNSKFQVIQRVEDPKTGKATYKYVASLKPVKNKIWDNRYNAVTEKAEGSQLTATTFKKTGGGEILPGMLIIEGKYTKITE